jgi:hypothetical protein
MPLCSPTTPGERSRQGKVYYGVRLGADVPPPRDGLRPTLRVENPSRSAMPVTDSGRVTDSVTDFRYEMESSQVASGEHSLTQKGEQRS